MGGNAIHGARRVGADEYRVLMRRVSAILGQVLPGVRHETIPAYREKLTFGDMDVLVERESLPSDWRHRVAEALRSQETVPNGPVCSFEFNRFQVDLITSPKAKFDFALGYFSWNDLGNLVGRIAHKFGFKFGHEGLFYPVRDGDHLVADVLVTDEFSGALSLLGFDASRWEQGFDTLEDVFAYVASSDCFDPAQFPLEHRSHRARVRDAKRPTYTKFLAWVDEHGPLCRRAVIAEDMLRNAFLRFPDFHSRYAAAHEALVRQRAAKERFNGRLVGEWTGLTGPALGQLMAELRSEAGGSVALQELVLRMAPDEVKTWVLSRHCPKLTSSPP